MQRAVVITVSDGVSEGTREDVSGDTAEARHGPCADWRTGPTTGSVRANRPSAERNTRPVSVSARVPPTGGSPRVER